MSGETLDFTALTESTGARLSVEGADMMYSRYVLAAEMAEGLRVLEIAAGSGQGLGLLQRSAQWVVAGDIDSALLGKGRLHYDSRVPMVCFNGGYLPFADGSFDLILLFEALYYFPDQNTTFNEMARVLNDSGALFIVSANPERADFISSPRSVHYHAAAELRAALVERGFRVQAYAAYSLREGGIATRVLGWIQRVAERFGLVPRTLGARALLKRLFIGPLVEVPAELVEGFGRVTDLFPIPTASAVRDHKVIYIKAERSGGRASVH